MDEPICKYFKVGIVSASSFAEQYAKDPYDVACTVARDPYFNAIELNPIGDAAVCERIAAVLRTAHMAICYGAQGKLLGTGLSLADTDETQRRAAVQAVQGGIDEAVCLGAERVGFLAGKWNQATREENFVQLVRSVGELCSYAGDKNILMELEVFDYDMDKASLIGPAPLAARLAAEVRCRHTNFGLVVDLSHFPTTYEDSTFVLRTLRPYITHLHFGNAVVCPGTPGYGDQHPRFGFPGSAYDEADLRNYLLVLRQEGFFAPQDPFVLSMEVKPFAGEDPETVLANTKRMLNRAWAMLPAE